MKWVKCVCVCVCVILTACIGTDEEAQWEADDAIGETSEWRIAFQEEDLLSEQVLDQNGEVVGWQVSQYPGSIESTTEEDTPLVPGGD